MLRTWLSRPALALFCGGLVALAPAQAGGLLPAGSCPCPGSLYSGCHFWAPQAFRAKMCLSGQTMDKTPIGIPACFRVIPYPCPAVDPAELYADSIYALLRPSKPAPPRSDTSAPTTPAGGERSGATP